jgi:sarcosine oxidase subunit alpha
VNLGEGGRFEPNQRATTTELSTGSPPPARTTGRASSSTSAREQLRQPVPAGGLLLQDVHPPARGFWKHVFEPFIRQSAGLGRAPKDRDADTYEHFHAMWMCW